MSQRSAIGHMACVRPAIDEHDAILAEQSVFVGVIDEARNEEFLLVAFHKVSIDRGAIVELGEPDARMRTAWTNDDWKLKLGRNIRK